MPRTSRKPKAVQTAAIPEVKEIVYNTGLYLRLSLMDSGIKGGESIINQQELLERYVAEKPELSLKGVFTDNGETGTDYDRPAWNDLMRECRAGKINCIIVRDLSRLGRNYIETGELLEKILPMLGVRLISINDNYDNLHLTLNEQLVANLKNLINDIYSKDIGRKVSTAVRAKKKNGEFMGTFAAYGYLKDPLDKHRLIIDPETAPTIVQIFEWKAQGLSHAEICRQLNESGISNPAYYRYEKGILTSERYSRREWITATVKNILENPVYLGHVAQGKKSSDLSTGQRQKRTSREDWIIVENTHAPIITQELYNQAHAVMRERTQKSLDGRKKHENVVSPPNILKGLVFCADCKKPIAKSRRIVREKYTYYVYVCKTNEELKNCPRKFIQEADLITAVHEAIRIETQRCADIMPIIEKLNRESGYKARLARFDAEIEEAQREIKRVSSLKQAIFEDYASKLITASEYQFAAEKYNADIEKQTLRLESALADKTKFSADSTPKNKWLVAFSQFMNEKELTAEMAKSLIERIELSDRDKVTITFKFRNEYEALIKYADSEVA